MMQKFWAPGIFALISLSACGPQSSHRENLKTTDTTETEAKYDELAPAEGSFVGTMHLSQSQQDFIFNLEIRRVMENVHSKPSEDPTDTISIPKLSGNLRFPAIQNLDIAEMHGFSELLNPMGGLQTVLFDFGDYNPKSKKLNLPYPIAGFNQGSFGELAGTYIQGHFEGTWFAKPYGTVAKFKAYKKSSDQGSDTGKGATP